MVWDIVLETGGTRAALVFCNSVGRGVLQTMFDVISQLAGLNVGCFYAVGTLLNRMIIEHYPVSPACVSMWTKYSVFSALPKALVTPPTV